MWRVGKVKVVYNSQQTDLISTRHPLFPLSISQSPRYRRIPSTEPDLSTRLHQLRSNISIRILRNNHSSSSSINTSSNPSASSITSLIPASFTSQISTSSATSQSSVPDPPSINASSVQVIHREDAYIQRVLPLARQFLDIGDYNIRCPYCNAFHWIHELSSKGTQRLPSFHTCYCDGRITLIPSPPLSSFDYKSHNICYLYDLPMFLEYFIND